VVVIEQVFPYGHPDHRPPDPVDVDALTEVDPATMSGPRLTSVLDGLEAARRRLDARYLAVLGEYDHRQVHAADGAISAATALEHRHGRDGRHLRRDVTTAGKLRELPLAAKTLGAGRITAEHVEELARVMTTKTRQAVIADEHRLVVMAQRLDVDRYRLALRHWKAHADPDGTEDPNAHLRRELHLSQSLDGDWFLKGHLDPEAGATVKTAIDGALDELHRGDRGDDGPSVPPACRRADALVEVCRRGGAVGPDGRPHRRTRPQVVVTIDHDNLVGQVGLGDLAVGGSVSATAVRRLACDADIIAAAFATDPELLDLGRAARLVSPAQRLALTLRDRGCAFPGCDRPAHWCDAHHIKHWTDDGPTDLDNLVLLCSAHHHLVHEGGWALRRDADGALVFTDPHDRVVHDRPRAPGRPDPWLTDPPEPRAPARRAHLEHDTCRAPA
jgi:hypothetical protein